MLVTSIDYERGRWGRWLVCKMNLLQCFSCNIDFRPPRLQTEVATNDVCKVPLQGEGIESVENYRRTQTITAQIYKQR